MIVNDSWRSLYPFASHYHAVATGRLHYLDEGQGRPLLMVHGNPTWSFYWRRLIPEFSPRYRCVVPDHLGCGLSDKPPAHAYTLQQHIDNLISLIDELELNEITLLGHDWGGAIGLGAALARRDRFSRLVLLNTGAFPPPFIPWRIRVCRIPVIGRLAVQGLNLFSLAALRMAVNNPAVLSPNVRQGLLAPYDTWANRNAVYRFVEDIPASPRHPTWQTLAHMEANLFLLNQLPVQLIWGMRDWCFRPSCLDRFREHFPSARVLRLPNAGHWVLEESPADVIRTLREFLEDTD